MKEFVEVVKQYGATGLLAIIVWWQNDRISNIEAKLYDCLNDRIENSVNKPISKKDVIYAILPEKDDKRYTRTKQPS